MKSYPRLTLLLLLLSFAMATPVFAQSPVCTFLSQSGAASFKINQENFTLFLSDKGQIADFNINAKGRVDYDLNGRLRSIGAVGVDYDLDNRIRKIGATSISYNLDNQVSQIGSLRISYNLNNQITGIGSTRISYDFNNRVSSIGD